MHIHFVCTGNIYRSRIAEAYLRSKKIPGVEESSSGTGALYYSGTKISPYASNILKEDGLMEYASKSMKQTTEEFLEKADLVVFMTKEHYNWAVDNANFKGDNYEIWNIEDVGASHIVQSVKDHVDDLIKRKLK